VEVGRLSTQLQFDVRFEVVNDEDEDLLIQVVDVEDKKAIIEEKRRKAAELRRQKQQERQFVKTLPSINRAQVRGKGSG
jgi:hypothetical protein